VHLAEDVAQQVFSSLAQNARFRLSSRGSGWMALHRRAKRCRGILCGLTVAEKREKMRPSPCKNSLWNLNQRRIGNACVLTSIAVMDMLNKRDRDAVLLRCLQGRPFAEIGNILRTSEDAARKRVDRALEKLRVCLPAVESRPRLLPSQRRFPPRRK